MTRFHLGKIFIVVAIFAGSCDALVLAEDVPPGDQYELQVGDRVYAITQGRPLTITTLNGERVRLLLRRPESRRFAAHGLSFRYAPEMNVNAERDDGQVTITVDSIDDSPMAVIQTQVIAGSLLEYRDQFAAAYRASLEDQGAIFSKMPKNPTRHVLFGKEQSAEVLTYELLGSEFRVELLVARRHDRVVSILLQHESADADLADRYFSTILESLADSK